MAQGGSERYVTMKDLENMTESLLKRLEGHNRDGGKGKGSGQKSGQSSDEEGGNQGYNSGNRGGANARRGRGRGGGRGRGRGGYQQQESRGEQGDEEKTEKKPSRPFPTPDSIHNIWALANGISSKIWTEVMLDQEIPQDKVLEEYHKRVQFMRTFKHIFRSPYTMMKGFVKVYANDKDEETKISADPTGKKRVATWTFRTVYEVNDRAPIGGEYYFDEYKFGKDYSFQGMEDALKSSLSPFRKSLDKEKYKDYVEEFQRAASKREVNRPNYFGRPKYGGSNGGMSRSASTDSLASLA